MLKLKLLIAFLIIFSLGWLSSTFLSNFMLFNIEEPFSISLNSFEKSPEKLSPSDHIKKDQITVLKDMVIINSNDISWASFTDTNSMDPFLDESSNSLEIKPSSEAQIKVGDIISYYSDITGKLIVHRVVARNIDGKGIYFIAKGDNNQKIDPEKIRFSQINGILIGILY